MELESHDDFTPAINIYSVTVERDPPAGGASASLNISFDELRNRISPILHTVPLGGVVGSTIAAPPDFSGHTWSRNLAVIGSGSTLTLDASFQRAGRHLVTLRADLNGRMYSQIVEIVVTT